MYCLKKGKGWYFIYHSKDIMDALYTIEKNVQIVIALLKAHNIRKIIVSPGGTNPSFVGSVQQDSYFELYSAVDERSAAYMACGLAAESGEAVALSCTGATAARNYVPGLTEAYYRKLPILAITATQYVGKVGHLIPQVTDRSNPLNDICVFSTLLPTIKSNDEEWSCIVNANSAMLALFRRGGGPVCINLETTYSKDFSVKELPKVRVINRIGYEDVFPKINESKVAIFVGSHINFDGELTRLIDLFCERYNAVVLCDHTSNYYGKFRVLPALVSLQKKNKSSLLEMDLLIHIGEISGAYYRLYPKKVWRVNPDGEIRDAFRKLTLVFEMSEAHFFKIYAEAKERMSDCSYLNCWKEELNAVNEKIPDLPFSNIWIQQQLLPKLPKDAVLHLGILNSLRSANFFEVATSVTSYANTGGFGIDGPISTLLGASLANEDVLFFGVVGDLGFFYDLNALGNRHIGKNVRILLINNGGGAEFCLSKTSGYDIKQYTAAFGHFGNKSPDLVKHFSKDLGFEYITAGSKEEFNANLDHFVDSRANEKPMVFEVFTESENERIALSLLQNIESSVKGVVKETVKNVAEETRLGRKGIETIKRIVTKI